VRQPRGEESNRFPPGGERGPREVGEERGGRPPRSRRGRGGRDRDEAAPPRPASYRAGAEDEEPERFGPPRVERPAAARTPYAADQEIDDELRDEMDEEDEGHGGDLPTHKQIPTWDEAVGILIDANMASRNNNPDRDRGRGRGRGRGR
jgi:hypothetical protein